MLTDDSLITYHKFQNVRDGSRRRLLIRMSNGGRPLWVTITVYGMDDNRHIIIIIEYLIQYCIKYIYIYIMSSIFTVNNNTEYES